MLPQRIFGNFWGHLAIPGDIFDCLNRSGGCGLEDRDVAEYLTVHRTDAQQELSNTKFRSARTGKAWPMSKTPGRVYLQNSVLSTHLVSGF